MLATCSPAASACTRLKLEASWICENVAGRAVMLASAHGCGTLPVPAALRLLLMSQTRLQEQPAFLRGRACQIRQGAAVTRSGAGGHNIVPHHAFVQLDTSALPLKGACSGWTAVCHRVCRGGMHTFVPYVRLVFAGCKVDPNTRKVHPGLDTQVCRPNLNDIRA